MSPSSQLLRTAGLGSTGARSTSRTSGSPGGSARGSPKRGRASPRAGVGHLGLGGSTALATNGLGGMTGTGWVDPNMLHDVAHRRGMEEQALELELAHRRTKLELDAADAAALLAGSGSSYREMPQAWVRRQLARSSPGFRIVGSSEFSSSLGPSYARSQLSYASEQAEQLPNAQLRAAFLASASAMRAKEAPDLRASGRNYAIVAKREPHGEPVSP